MSRSGVYLLTCCILRRMGSNFSLTHYSMETSKDLHWIFMQEIFVVKWYITQQGGKGSSRRVINLNHLFAVRFCCFGFTTWLLLRSGLLRRSTRCILLFLRVTRCCFFSLLRCSLWRINGRTCFNMRRHFIEAGCSLPWQDPAYLLLLWLLFFFFFCLLFFLRFCLLLLWGL